MTWFRVDDSLGFHHKVIEAGNAAMGLWVRAGAWCAQQLNDGVVPATMVRALGGQTTHAKALVRCGLWDEIDGRYVFHDWELYQPTSAEVRAARLAKSEKRAAAGRAGGIASGVSRRANGEANQPSVGSKDEANDEAPGEANAKQNGSKDEPPSLPYPSLPSLAQPAVASSERDLRFEEFWLVYPRKVGKGHARKAWDKAIKQHAVELIMTGAARLARQGLEERFTPHPATWLNGERWLDQPATAPAGNVSTAWAREQG